MRNNFTFREPLGKDEDGLYITAGQMQFFLNRREGQKKFSEGDPVFFKYYYKCAVYNIVWDLLENDPTCATLFWDDERETVGVSFPLDGAVTQEFKDRNIEYLLDDEDEEEEYE